MSAQKSTAYRSGLALVGLCAVITVTGCTAEELPVSGAQDPKVVVARKQLVEEQTQLLAAAALQAPLSTSVHDTCIRGAYSVPWGPFDNYYWQCQLANSWVVGTDLEDPATLIAAYRTHLGAVGCEPDAADFDQLASYWGTFGTTGRTDSGEIYTVDSPLPRLLTAPTEHRSP